ncbi:polysaccharide biosynthesis protein [Vibrio bathopelagicus]|uniref:hypothetical protein n=1 Tax=Vibrio bathopelagicus TaxID=2777577 RepID=UPI0018643DCB|nr:hypothetical protein [Vibrio bathopelagicus]
MTLHEFGVLALIQASLSVIEGVSSSQSWQGLVRFLPKSSSTSAIGVGRLIKITLITDIFNAILASVILIFVVYFSNWFGIPNSELLLLYGLVLPFRMNGTWQGIARSQNKLVLINIQLIISGFGKLITAFGVFFIPETTFSTVVLGFVLSEIISYLVLIISGIVIVDKQWTLSSLIFDGRQQYTNDSEIRKFIFINHFNVSSVLAIRNVDELIVGKLISPEVTGVYKLIKLISALLSKVIEPMYIVIYPEFNRLLSHGKTSELKTCLGVYLELRLLHRFFYINMCDSWRLFY